MPLGHFEIAKMPFIKNSLKFHTTLTITNALIFRNTGSFYLFIVLFKYVVIALEVILSGPNLKPNLNTTNFVFTYCRSEN